MIECSNENIYYKRRPKKRRLFRYIVIAIIIISLAFYYKNYVTKTVTNISISYTKSYSTNAVNKAILDSLSDKISYSDLINIEKNINGDIVLMTANSYKINLINKNISTKTNEILSESINRGIPIPIMAFSGVEILSGYGREIKLKTVSVTSVSAQFQSNFSSVGINQTLHSIYITVVSTVDVNLPFKNHSVEHVNSVLISETILVGKVPDTYLNGGLFINS